MAIVILSAPSNLGLRPPQPGSVPGTAKAPEALREAGLFQALAGVGAEDGGVVVPGRYVDDYIPGSGRVRNQDEIVKFTHRLAHRIGGLLDVGSAPLILGGDCSLLIGAGLSLARRGRYGLVHIDGHTDFRHPGNSTECSSLAGEDLAAVIGRHWPALADIDGFAPYIAPRDAVHVGCRADDQYLSEAGAALGGLHPASEVITSSASTMAGRIRDVVAAPALAGYWLHLDVDVLDPAHLPAVDSPDPGGLDPDQVLGLLEELAPGAVGAQVTVFDPDLDPDGRYALLLSDLMSAGLRDLGRDRPSPTAGQTWAKASTQAEGLSGGSDFSL